MINVFEYEKWQFKRIKVELKDGTFTKGKLLSIDNEEDNDVDDAFVLDVNGDETIGRAVYRKDIKSVKLLD